MNKSPIIEYTYKVIAKDQHISLPYPVRPGDYIQFYDGSTLRVLRIVHHFDKQTNYIYSSLETSNIPNIS
jgi:hypothetical protein